MKLVAALLSLVCSFGVAELGASLLHRRAFPFLNIFQADARYGVVLKPNATVRIRSRLGHVTEVRTNSLGFRGDEWAQGGVMLIGDSQALGYNVDWESSMAPALSRALGAPVLDTAVPSWGPAEYVMAIHDHAPRFRPRHVVILANIANDWFESFVPNARRSTSLDGWAARWYHGMQKPVDFPFRELLMGRSHLVLAARELWERGKSHSAGAELSPSDAASMLARDHDKLLAQHPLAGMVRAAAAACRQHGCSVVIAALPLDVMVDAAQWKKYRTGAHPPLDRAEALLQDLVDQSQASGVAAVNLLPPLREASPGAFLEDDYHLSPRGHTAVANAIANAILPERAHK